MTPVAFKVGRKLRKPSISVVTATCGMEALVPHDLQPPLIRAFLHTTSKLSLLLLDYAYAISRCYGEHQALPANLWSLQAGV